MQAPQNFQVYTANVGLKEQGRDDFFVAVSTSPAAVSAVFTKSRFAGPSVAPSRAACRDKCARGVVVLSRDANVATGPSGAQDAAEVRQSVAQAIGIDADELLIASTGVIGRRYPMTTLREQLAHVSWPFPGADFDRAAQAMMTTDTRHKIIWLRCGEATIVGIAKGIGMIEPDMATLLAFFFTDAELPAPDLGRVFRRIVDRTFNAVSVYTDTSTSDTAAIFANGCVGPDAPEEFEPVLHQAALDLTRQIARDGEGATKLIEVRVTGARDDAQDKRVGKAIVNSPLVKTAVHGGDPNWGRVAMAIGKCQDDLDIEPERVTIRFADIKVYPAAADDLVLARLTDQLKSDEVVIQVDLGIAAGQFTVYGCDLTAGYVQVNTIYLT